MKRELLFLSCAIISIATISCAPRNRTVENPFIEAANTETLDITKVTVSDTATILHVEAYFRPKYWIKIAAGSYLEADGEKYPLTGSKGIDADSLFWMPDTGRASFDLIFSPFKRIPKKFDFIETECDDCFKLYGIDLTGKRTTKAFPDGLPASLRGAAEGEVTLAPIFKVGESTLNVHLLGYRKGMFPKVALGVSSLLSAKELTSEIDSAGTATFRFEQYGTATAYIGPSGVGRLFGTLWLAPGETTDVYVDLEETGRYLMNRRNEGQPAVHRPRLYATGTYGALNTISNTTGYGRISMNLYDGEFADYRMTADEYVRMVESKYRTLCDSISRSDCPDPLKQFHTTVLKHEAISAMANAAFLQEHNYRSEKDLWTRDAKIDRKFAELRPEHYAAVCKWFDINDPTLLTGGSAGEYLRAITRPDIDWPKIAGITEGQVIDLRRLGRLPARAENGELTDEELAELRTLSNPFYAQACEAMQAQARSELARLEGKVRIETTPDVPHGKLFQTIVAPYKDKIVFVDFWNTWCGPCRAALAANEPLKQGELKSDGIVWLYIANESSPIVAYKKAIAEIAGIHYRLNNEEWTALCKQFGITGIPSYVLVSRDGTCRLRNDLRDHDKLQKTLKGMLAE